MDTVRMGSNKAADIVELASERQKREDVSGTAHAEVSDASDTVSSTELIDQQPSPASQPNLTVSPAETLDEDATAGQMLAAARKAAGLSIQDVVARTNIREDRVIAIEAMDVSSLPLPAYTLGFVRSYAKLLVLPADALVNRFRKDAGYPEPSDRPIVHAREKKNLNPPQQVNLLTVLGIVALIVWFAWQIVQTIAPDEPVSVQGTPLSERVRPQTEDNYEVGTSLNDVDPIVPQNVSATISLPGQGAPSATPDANNSLSDEISIVHSGEEASATDLAQLGATEPGRDEVGGETTDLDAGSTVSDIEEPADAQNVVDLNVQTLAALQGENESAAEANETVTLESQEQLEPTTAQAGVEASEEEASPPTNSGDEQAPLEIAATDPIVRHSVSPVYPTRCETSAEARETVTIAFRVSRYGKVMGPEVRESTNDCFDGAALAAVSRWDFEPATENGKSVASQERTTRVVFELPQ